MTAKLSDVAKLAGVSPSTVSRVINRRGYLSQKTIDKVQKAMTSLDYHPNSLARSLQGKATRIIGLIFPNLSNVFYAELIEKLEHRLFDKGYKIILCNSENNPQKEKNYLDMLLANQVDGIISGSHNLNIRDYENSSAPIISFDRNLSPTIPVVSSDNFQGGKLAAETLKKENCHNVLMITGNDDSNSPTSQRSEGFSSVLTDAKIIHLSSRFSPMRKTLEIESLLHQYQPDGVFVSDDLTALILKQVIAKKSVKLDQAIKIVGYDGTQFIRDFHPELTTIVQPLSEIADLLVELLLKKIQHQPILESHYTLPVSLHLGKMP